MEATKKTALVTGANRGLGLEISRQLGRLGMRVWLGARQPAAGQAAERQLRAEGLDATYLPLDLASPASVAAAVAQVGPGGRLDVLVNNAAMQVAEGQLPSAIAPELLHQFLDTNYMAQVRVTQAFLPLLRRSPAGRIVNMSTSLGSLTVMGELEHPYASNNLLGYSSAKAALNMFTVLLAKELQDTPIKVNSADPNWTRTELGGPAATHSVEESAPVAVWLATLDEHGPTGGFFGRGVVNPW